MKENFNSITLFCLIYLKEILTYVNLMNNIKFSVDSIIFGKSASQPESCINIYLLLYLFPLLLLILLKKQIISSDVRLIYQQ